MKPMFEEIVAFSKDKIKPYANQFDQNGQYPKEAMKYIHKQGYLSLLIPKEKGGLGGGILNHTEACMALAASSGSVGLIYMMHNVVLHQINEMASEKLKNDVYQSIIDEGALIALAASEPKGGANVTGPQTKAILLDDGKYEINGIKSMVTTGGYAKYYLVHCASNEEGLMDNFLIELNSEGLSFEENKWNGFGMRANVSCPMLLDHVKVDKYKKVGASGDGIKGLNIRSVPFVLGLASVYAGLCIGLVDAVYDHIKKRKIESGNDLLKYESIKYHFAKVYNYMNSAKSIVFDAARSYENGDRDYLQKVYSARIVATECAMESAKYSMRIGGGRSYNKENEIERILRDSYAGQVMLPSLDGLESQLTEMFFEK